MNVGEFYLERMLSSSNKTIRLVKIGSITSDLIQHWKTVLEITEWVISCESISEMQVVDALKNNSYGHEFVGIAINFETTNGVIYHTRPLYEDDIIHELLHVRFPSWSEQDVNFLTNLLLDRTRAEMAHNRNILVVNA